MEDDEKDKSKFKKIVLKLAVYISIPIFLLLFIPSKRDMLMIIGIGGTIEYLKSNDTANKLPDKVIMAIDKLLDDTIEEEKWMLPRLNHIANYYTLQPKPYTAVRQAIREY